MRQAEPPAGRRIFGVLAALLMYPGAPMAALYPAQPAVGDGLVCLSDSGLACFDRRAVTRRWTSLSSNYTFAPVITGSRVLAGSTVGLHAVNRTNGNPVWGWNDGVGTSSPVLEDGAVYAAGHHGRLASLDLEAGKVQWQRRLSGRLYTPALIDGLVVAGSRSGRVFAVERETGDTVWTYSMNQAILNRPVAVPGGVVLSTFSGSVRMLAPDGEVLWRQDTGVPAFGPTLGDGSALIFGGMDGTLRARDRASGALRWQTPLSGRLSIPAAVRGGEVAVVNPDGEMAIVAAANGAVLKRTTLPGAALGAPVPLEDGGWRVFYREGGDIDWVEVSS